MLPRCCCRYAYAFRHAIAARHAYAPIPRHIYAAAFFCRLLRFAAATILMLLPPSREIELRRDVCCLFYRDLRYARGEREE